MTRASKESAVISATAGQRLVFGLVDPDDNAMYQLQYGFMPPDGQAITDVIWQNVRVAGKDVFLDVQNYPLIYNVSATGMYKLVNAAGDNTEAKPVLIEQYTVHKYESTGKTI